MKFIALRSIDRDSDDLPTPPASRYDVETDRGRTIDDSSDTGMRFINPSLVCPLEEVWISKRKSNGSHNPHDGRA
jgi:calcium permeable stress-gated cation channel